MYVCVSAAEDRWQLLVAHLTDRLCVCVCACFCLLHPTVYYDEAGEPLRGERRKEVKTT